mgnify:CR=1 FL=1
MNGEHNWQHIAQFVAFIVYRFTDYPMMYLAGLPIRFTKFTINQDTRKATIAAIGICKGIGILSVLTNTTDGPVKK